MFICYIKVFLTKIKNKPIIIIIIIIIKHIGVDVFLFVFLHHLLNIKSTYIIYTELIFKILTSN